MGYFIGFCQWMQSVVYDPNDKQGSSKRVAMLMIVTVLCLTLLGLVIYLGQYPEVPTSLAVLIFGLFTGLGFLVSVDKGIATWERVKGAGNAGTNDEQGPQG